MKTPLFRTAWLTAVALLAATTLTAANSDEELRNKDIVSKWMAMVWGGQAEEAFRLYVSPDFRQHGHRNNGVGYALMLEALKKMRATPERPFTITKAVADEDMVTMQTSVGIDLYRVKDGKITDHWDGSAEFDFINTVGPNAAK